MTLWPVGYASQLEEPLIASLPFGKAKAKEEDHNFFFRRVPQPETGRLVSGSLEVQQPDCEPHATLLARDGTGPRPFFTACELLHIGGR